MDANSTNPSQHTCVLPTLVKKRAQEIAQSFDANHGEIEWHSRRWRETHLRFQKLFRRECSPSGCGRPTAQLQRRDILPGCERGRRHRPAREQSCAECTLQLVRQGAFLERRVRFLNRKNERWRDGNATPSDCFIPLPGVPGLPSARTCHLRGCSWGRQSALPELVLQMGKQTCRACGGAGGRQYNDAVNRISTWHNCGGCLVAE